MGHRTSLVASFSCAFAAILQQTMSTILKALLLALLLQPVVRCEETDAGTEDSGSDEESEPAVVMKELDTDKNGKLSLAEVLSNFEGEEDSGFRVQVENFFKEADADSNHQLTIEEIPKFVELVHQADEL